MPSPDFPPDRDPSHGSSTCESDPAPVLTHHITDLDKIAHIMPTIVGSGNWLKNRSYLVIGRDAQDRPYQAPVYAPVDSRLIGITYYDQPMLDQAGEWVRIPQYQLRFRISCEVTYGFDHLWSLAEPLAELAAPEPSHTSRDAERWVDLPVRGGDLIGYTTGTILAHTWDIIVNNSAREPVRFANQARYAGVSDLRQLLTSDCPFDYFAPELRSAYTSRFGGFYGLDPETGCDLSPDRLGTVAGGWFQAPYVAETWVGPEPGWGLAVMREADGGIAINGESHEIRVSPQDPTYADPKTVTGQHCYQHRFQPLHYVYLELRSDTELAVKFGEGSCPAALPEGYSVFYR